MIEFLAVGSRAEKIVIHPVPSDRAKYPTQNISHETAATAAHGCARAVASSRADAAAIGTRRTAHQTANEKKTHEQGNHQHNRPKPSTAGRLLEGNRSTGNAMGAAWLRAASEVFPWSVGKSCPS